MHVPCRDTLAERLKPRQKSNCMHARTAMAETSLCKRNKAWLREGVPAEQKKKLHIEIPYEDSLCTLQQKKSAVVKDLWGNWFQCDRFPSVREHGRSQLYAHKMSLGTLAPHRAFQRISVTTAAIFPPQSLTDDRWRLYQRHHIHVPWTLHSYGCCS